MVSIPTSPDGVAQAHLGHEHSFYPHDDPRWLVCDCGQFAVRARTIAGEASVRLIDPPRPVLAVSPSALGTPREQLDPGSGVHGHPAARPHLQPPAAPGQHVSPPSALRLRGCDVIGRTSDFVIEIDPCMTITWASPSLTDVLGWDPEQWVGTPASTWFPDDEAGASWRLLARVLHGELVSGPRRVLAADGHTPWVDRTANLLRDWSGEVVAIVTGFHLLAETSAQVRSELVGQAMAGGLPHAVVQ